MSLNWVLGISANASRNIEILTDDRLRSVVDIHALITNSASTQQRTKRHQPHCPEAKGRTCRFATE